MNYLRKNGEVFLLVIVLVAGALWGAARLFPPMSLPQKGLLLLLLLFWTVSFAYCLFRSDFPFFRKYQAPIGLAVLVVYVIALGVLTVSEIFDLGWFDWI